MLTYPDIDPIAFSIGSWSVRWYGLSYLAGFATAWWLGRVRARQSERGWQVPEIDDLLFYVAIGVIAGGRLGYVLFYNLPETLADPLGLIRIWQGGMSFHGGLLGVLVAMWLYARATERTFFQVTDFIVPLVPPALGFGRIGNFVNGELWGQVSNVPWAMVFPNAGVLPRHPSQLYQALLEGFALFAILWLFSRRPRPVMAVSGLFLVGYGLFRSLVELVRVPDEHIGYLAFDWLTMGQLLSLPMVVAGLGFMFWAYRHPVMPEARIVPAVPAPPSEQPAGGRRRKRSRRGKRG